MHPVYPGNNLFGASQPAIAPSIKLIPTFSSFLFYHSTYLSPRWTAVHPKPWCVNKNVRRRNLEWMRYRGSGPTAVSIGYEMMQENGHVPRVYINNVRNRTTDACLHFLISMHKLTHRFELTNTCSVTSGPKTTHLMHINISRDFNIPTWSEIR